MKMQSRLVKIVKKLQGKITNQYSNNIDFARVRHCKYYVENTNLVRDTQNKHLCRKQGSYLRKPKQMLVNHQVVDA